MQNALATKYYAPHLLVLLTERDNFMRLTDFFIYNEALANTAFFEIEEIAKTDNYDESFLKFLRYVQMLDASDLKQKEGQKFVDLVYNLDKFQAYKNQSLHIFDNESIVLEEEGLEEGAHKVHAQSAVPQSRA
jgi:coproporphyrinogen III oxidase-like Fe-S oxidoreductase